MTNLVVNEALPDFLQQAGVSELTSQLAGRAAIKRIVPKNGSFKLMVRGKEMGKLKGDLHAIIINASPRIGRIFYAAQWDPAAEPTAPDCFSNDGNVPDAKAANPQARSCNECPKNVKGSGQGQSKACRYSRRIAVLLEQDFGTNLEGQVYQMNLSATSLFGDNVNDAFTFENYSKYLSSNGKSIDYMVTRISFNENTDNQSVLFNPVRYINRAEHDVASRAEVFEQTKQLVVLTPAQADGVTKLPSQAPAQAAAPAPVAEPTKRQSKKTVDEEPKAKKNLADVVSAWSGED